MNKFEIDPILDQEILKEELNEIQSFNYNFNKVRESVNNLAGNIVLVIYQDDRPKLREWIKLWQRKEEMECPGSNSVQAEIAGNVVIFIFNFSYNGVFPKGEYKDGFYKVICRNGDPNYEKNNE